MPSLTGQLLVASPGLHDPNFRRTVVLITEHTEDGAAGLVLNRPTEAEVSDVVRAQAQLGDLYFEQLGTLLEGLRAVGEQAMRYFDAAFARVEADPVWNENLREAFGPDGKPRGVRIAELPDDVDG